MNYPNPVELATPFFVLLIFFEIIYGRFSGRVVYEPWDTASSLFLGFGSIVVGALISVGGQLYRFMEQFAVFDISFSIPVVILCFFLDDLAYYWFHRLAHRVRWFWAAHVIHHSSQHYNLSTALRQTWTGQIALAFLFRLPLVIIGFPLEMIAFTAGINLVYQFWIHTEAIDRMGFLEHFMNTPSHHRVHHATNPKYLDSNYAGAFIIWDKMFGTFVEEDPKEAPKYGIINNIATYNPFRAAFHEWASILRDLLNAQSWSHRLKYIIAPPGWSPDGSRETSDSIKAKWLAAQADK